MDLHFGNIKSLGDVIKAWVAEHKMQASVQEAQLARDWPKIVGIATSNATKGLTLRNGTLTVQIASAALRREFHMRRSAFVSKVNEFYGNVIVNGVIFK